MYQPLLKSWLARLKMLTGSWRLTMAEMSHDYQVMFTRWRRYKLSLWRTKLAFSWILLFLLGVATGIVLKTLTHSRLMIGHEDYRLLPMDRLYALNELRERALERGTALPVREQRSYPACSSPTDLDEVL